MAIASSTSQEPFRIDPLADEMSRVDGPHSTPASSLVRACRGRWVIDLQEASSVVSAGDIVVDFSGIDRISSLELKEVVRLQLRLKLKGRRLVFEQLQDVVRDVFQMTRLDRLVELR